MATLLLPLAIGVGGMLLSAALAPKQKDQYGPRISDINIGQVSPGNPIVRLWGTMKVPTQLIWTSELIETKRKQDTSQGKGGGGGKGGGKGGSPNVYYYTYSVDAAFAVCEGPVYRINRIWANQKLLWMHQDILINWQEDFDAAYYAELDRLVNQENLSDIDEAYCGAYIFAFNNYSSDEYTQGSVSEAVAYIMSHIGSSLHPPVAAPNQTRVTSLLTQMLDGLGKDNTYSKHKLRFDSAYMYYGSETQLPNAVMEEYLGVGNVPAYRGLCYFVLRNLQLEDFGNGIPTITVEVQKNELGSSYLYEIIGDVCTRCGLTSDEADSLAQIPTSITVPGYAITQTQSGRQVLNSLQSVFPFDASETAYKIVFNWINTRPVAILRREDFGAHADDQELPPSVEVVRSMDLDLPQRLNLKFQEPIRNYSPNHVYAVRTCTDSLLTESIDTTIALTRSQAKTRVEEILALRFSARKIHRVILPKKYVVLEPGDAVLVPDKNYPPEENQYLTWRCLQTDIAANGMIDAVFSDFDPWLHSVAVTESDLTGSDSSVTQLTQASPTVPYMLDIPLLSDTEADNPGFYVVLSGNNSGWSGGVLLVDLSSGQSITVFGETTTQNSSGSSWYTACRNNTQVAHGHSLTALLPCKPFTWDYASRVRVFLRSHNIVMSSATQNDLLTQPINVAMIGDEIVQFSSAVDLGNGIWELSTFLRGLRGTDYACGTHIPGERFVRLVSSATIRVEHASSMLNVASSYKAVSFGAATDSQSSFSFADTGNSLRPFAPTILEQVRRVDTGDIYLRWSPRVRRNGGLINGSATALDPDAESYTIDVLGGSGNVLRSVLISNRYYEYSYSDQVADFITVPDVIHMKLYQVGKIVGRGFAAKVEA